MEASDAVHILRSGGRHPITAVLQLHLQQDTVACYKASSFWVMERVIPEDPTLMRPPRHILQSEVYPLTVYHLVWDARPAFSVPAAAGLTSSAHPPALCASTLFSTH